MWAIPESLELFVIGTSAGGIEALERIIPAFKRTSHFKVVIVVHMPPTGPNLLPSLMKELTRLTIKEAEAGETLVADHIYIAPPNYHLLVEPNGTLSLSNEELVHFSRPSIDLMFESAAYAYSKKTIGVLLTGANEDGARGLKIIQDAGGTTIVQDPTEAEYSIMPESALKLMRPDFVMSNNQIIEYITSICSQDKYHD